MWERGTVFRPGRKRMDIRKSQAIECVCPAGDEDGEAGTAPLGEVDGDIRVDPGAAAVGRLAGPREDVCICGDSRICTNVVKIGLL